MNLRCKQICEKNERDAGRSYGCCRTIREITINNWCVIYFTDDGKCHVIDNNICETFNEVMLEGRSKPIIAILEEIRRCVMQRVIVKRNHVKK